MILRIFPYFVALAFLQNARAAVAPEITTVEEGYNLVAKIPCLGCPFLFQDTSKGSNEPWTERKDENALLLNFSLPYDSAYLTINNAPLYSGRRNLPRIFANQVVQDLSVDDLDKSISSGQLEASHETNLGGGFFGLSYRQSLRSVQTSQKLDALLFQFEILELWSDLPTPAIEHKLDDPEQTMLEVLLIQKPLLSALSPSPTYEILNASLVLRTQNHLSGSNKNQQTTMQFHDWDDYGKKGTTSHALSYGATSFVEYVASGFWGLFVFIIGVIALFVLACLVCIFGWGFWEDDYEKAQHGKHKRGRSGRGSRSSGSWRPSDVEMAKGRFKSAEELGLMGRGTVVGMGKSD